MRNTFNHDYSQVFDTDNPLWERVLEIYNRNEEYPKKRTKGRELHHKFPRSFSKRLGETVDNTQENLVSLTPDDHFRVHYYYYILAKKGFRQPMALAFDLMVRPMSKQISPATMEECAYDYAVLRRERLQAWLEKMRDWREKHPEQENERLAKAKATLNTEDSRKKRSEIMRGKNAGSANSMYGKSSPMKGHSCTEWMTDEEIIRWKEAISKSNKGRTFSNETRQKISDSHKGENNPMFRKFHWKDSENVWHTLDIPDIVPDEELSDIRIVLHVLLGPGEGDWRKRIKKVTELLELMDSYKYKSIIKD